MPNKYPTHHNERRADLATIHMAATQLGMDTADKFKRLALARLKRKKV
jgi:hypothetical protein